MVDDLVKLAKDEVTPVAVDSGGIGRDVGRKTQDSEHDDNVTDLANRIKKAVKALRAEGTVGMSKENLKQMVNSRGLSFANANHFERSFSEALEKAGVGRFVRDAAQDVLPVAVGRDADRFKLGYYVRVIGTSADIAGPITHITHSEDFTRYKVEGRYFNEDSLTRVNPTKQLRERVRDVEPVEVRT